MQELTLKQLREQCELSQLDIAKAVKTTQSAISKFELRGDNSIKQLRKYLTALGGELELVAIFHNVEYKIKT